MLRRVRVFSSKRRRAGTDLGDFLVNHKGQPFNDVEDLNDREVFQALEGGYYLTLVSPKGVELGSVSQTGSEYMLQVGRLNLGISKPEMKEALKTQRKRGTRFSLLDAPESKY